MTGAEEPIPVTMVMVTHHLHPLGVAPAAPIHTPLAMITAPHGMPSAMDVPKEVTGMWSATALALWANMPLNPMEL